DQLTGGGELLGLRESDEHPVRLVLNEQDGGGGVLVGHGGPEANRVAALGLPGGQLPDLTGRGQGRERITGEGRRRQEQGDDRAEEEAGAYERGTPDRGGTGSGSWAQRGCVHEAMKRDRCEPRPTRLPGEKTAVNLNRWNYRTRKSYLQTAQLAGQAPAGADAVVSRGGRLPRRPGPRPVRSAAGGRAGTRAGTTRRPAPAPPRRRQCL